MPNMNPAKTNPMSLFGVVLARLAMIVWALLRGRRVGKRAVVMWLVLALIAAIKWVMQTEEDSARSHGAIRGRSRRRGKRTPAMPVA